MPLEKKSVSFYNEVSQNLVAHRLEEELVRNLIDMDGKSDIGYIDWEFIHDMQAIDPDHITPELIYLTREFLDKIPEKWDEIKAKLASRIKKGKIVHIAIEDVENLGNDFKVRGILKDKQGRPVPFCKIVVMDKDPMEDDYLGAVITDQDGEFSVSFGKRAFSDFNMEAEPEVYFKIYTWKDSGFFPIGSVTPEVFEKVETKEGKVVLEFGVVEI